MAKEKKTKKHDTFIDMTAMSDMTVLLLTFFMLTATFLPLEPVQVITPGSVSETKIPEYDDLMILIEPSGKVFMNISGGKESTAAVKRKLIEDMSAQYGVKLNDAQKKAFMEDATFAAVPMKDMPEYLKLSGSERNEMARKKGIPIDSANNELENWVKFAKAANKDLTISIKADQSTEYQKVDDVLKTLIKIRENRYSLVTTLAGMPEDL